MKIVQWWLCQTAVVVGSHAATGIAKPFVPGRPPRVNLATEIIKTGSRLRR